MAWLSFPLIFLYLLDLIRYLNIDIKIINISIVRAIPK